MWVEYISVYIYIYIYKRGIAGQRGCTADRKVQHQHQDHFAGPHAPACFLLAGRHHTEAVPQRVFRHGLCAFVGAPGSVPARVEGWVGGGGQQQIRLIRLAWIRLAWNRLA